MGMTRIRNRGEGMQLEIRGATVDVTMSGDSGRGVLLLHGFMCSAQMMSSVQEALCGQMRVAAIDFPGHGKNGRSAPPPKPWGVPDYMEMTAEIIRRLNLAPCDIVAHSFGARVAILLAATYPELVGRMILTGAAGHGAVFALVTTEPHYAGSVTVYNKAGEELVKWYSSDQIVDVDFSSDDSRLAAACVSFDKSGELVASVHVIDIRKETEVAAPEFSGVLPVAVDYKKGGQIHLVCDSALAIAEKDLKTTRTEPYLRQLQAYAFTEEETLLVSSDSHEAASTITLTPGEGESRSVTVPAAVEDIAASGDGVSVLMASEVRRYTRKFELAGTYRVSSGVFRIEMAGDRVFSLSKSYLDVLGDKETESPAESEGSN